MSSSLKFFLGFFLVSWIGPFALGGSLQVVGKACQDHLSELARSESVRRDSAHYKTARQFTEQVGIPFAKLVEERLDGSGRTHIVIALGGAEHLGNVVESYLRARKPDRDITLSFLYTTQAVVGAWKVSVGKTKDNRDKIVMGYGKKPLKYFFKQSDAKKAGNSEQEVLEYLSQNGVFDSDKVVVVDTGFEGTIPEIVGQLGQVAGYRGDVEGVLLYQNLKNVISRRVPVFGANHLLFHENSDETILKWAYLLDEGLDLTDPIELEYFRRRLNSGYEPQQVPYFPKSRPSVKRLVRGEKGWGPEEPVNDNERKKQRYLETVRAIEDVIQERFSEEQTP